jgi:hypothetical protein
LYRAKDHEEDISVTNEVTNVSFPLSLKAYGDGPLQLSTDKHFTLFPALTKMGKLIEGDLIGAMWAAKEFESFGNLNILPLIYDEKNQKCNILVFDHERAKSAVRKVVFEDAGSGRKHPVFRFYDGQGDYVCEVRYGNAAANALQRGLWSHTRNGLKYFDSITNGWISYSHNLHIVKLLSSALVATSRGHEAAMEYLHRDIEAQKSQSALGAN